MGIWEADVMGPNPIRINDLVKTDVLLTFSLEDILNEKGRAGGGGPVSHRRRGRTVAVRGPVAPWLCCAPWAVRAASPRPAQAQRTGAWSPPTVRDLKVLLVPVVHPVGVSPLTVAEEGTSSSSRGSELSAEETPITQGWQPLDACCGQASLPETLSGKQAPSRTARLPQHPSASLWNLTGPCPEGEARPPDLSHWHCVPSTCTVGDSEQSVVRVAVLDLTYAFVLVITDRSGSRSERLSRVVGSPCDEQEPGEPVVMAAVLAPAPPPPPIQGYAFKPPPRPDFGTSGRTIKLQANFFEMDIPKIDIYHYELDIKPEKCPRRVNSYDYKV
ncbi:hypothetical protein CB1_001219012 [Camelus ferus]|nr:hypothetical protein CB1_001219012 [Camelus ferus]